MVTIERPTRAGLVSALSGPVGTDVAICVPLSGKKVVLPTAQWGKVASDARVISWTPRHLRQLRAAVALREMGVGEPDLADDAPPFYLLSRTDPSEHAEITRMWRVLDPLRSDKTLLPLFLHLSRKDKAS